MNISYQKRITFATIRKYGAALGYFAITNALRIALLVGSGDNTYFQADYALPPLFFWLAMIVRAPRWMMTAGTFAIALLVFSGDIVIVLGHQFRWGPDAVPQYLLAYRDLPWPLIAPIVITVLAVALISAIFLLFRARVRIVIWPMIGFMLALLMADMIIGTGRYRNVAGGVNLITASSVSLVSTYMGMFSGSAVSLIQQDTMQSVVPAPPAARQILSIALESYGLARRPDQRAALIQPLLREVGATYDVVQGAHPFSGATFQGEVRELCGLKLVGYPTRDRLANKLRRCLPNRLGRMGFDSWALHGNGGQFYNRNTFYPLMGFRHVEFYDQLRAVYPTAQPCRGTAFRGFCDEQVYARAIGLFDGSKRFVHVMTLDSHLPVYPATPPACAAEYAGDPALCGYDALLGRSLAQLGRALMRGQVKPELIFIFGDHAPPFSTENTRHVFDAERIPFITLRKRTIQGEAVLQRP